MPKKKHDPVHPGEILLEDVLVPMGLQKDYELDVEKDHLDG